MRWDELKEQLLARFQSIWGELQESSLYIRLKERYDELSPSMQKIVSMGAVGTLLFILLLIPLLGLLNSMTTMSDFDDTRVALRDLVRLGRLQSQTSNVPEAPAPPQIQSQIQTVLTQNRLLVEQIRQNDPMTFEPVPSSTLIPKGISQEGVQVTLVKLNLTQILDISHQLSNMPGAHLMAMDMKANNEDSHYFDVMFRVVGFKIE